MAINNTTSDFAFMEFPMAFSRQDGFPLDKNVKGDRPGGRFEFSMGQFF